MSLTKQVLNFVKKRGRRGATDEEIQEALGGSRGLSTVFRPRRRELVKRGKIKATRKTRRTLFGRDAIIWIVV